VIRSGVLLGVVLLYAGCATGGGPPPVVRPLPGPVEPGVYARFAGSGEAELSGQAFLTTRGGEVRVAAGRLVTLDPATDYALEWFRRFGGNADDFTALPPDPGFAGARRTTVADAEGRFGFASLPAGTYIVRTAVTWETGSYDDLQGGVVADIVTLDGAESRQVVLSEVYETSYAASLGVPVLTDGDLAARPYVVIAELSGESCRAGLIGPDPDERAARDDLVIRAARYPEVDAVGRVACRSGGMSLSCTSRIICDGIAIQWTG